MTDLVTSSCLAHPPPFFNIVCFRDWVKGCAKWVSWWGKLMSKANAGMQILLQTHSAYTIGRASFHSLLLSNLHCHPAWSPLFPISLDSKRRHLSPENVIGVASSAGTLRREQIVRWHQNREASDRIMSALLWTCCSSWKTWADASLIACFIADCCRVAGESHIWHLSARSAFWSFTWGVSQAPSLSLKMSYPFSKLFRIQYNV